MKIICCVFNYVELELVEVILNDKSIFHIGGSYVLI